MKFAIIVTNSKVNVANLGTLDKKKNYVTELSIETQPDGPPEDECP